MASPGAEDFRLTVLNPGGRDPSTFQDTVARAAEHPPTSFHGYAVHARSFHHDPAGRSQEHRFFFFCAAIPGLGRALNEVRHGRPVELPEERPAPLRSNYAIAQVIAFHGNSGAGRWMHLSPEAAGNLRRALPTRSATVAFIPAIQSVGNGTFLCHLGNKRNFCRHARI